MSFVDELHWYQLFVLIGMMLTCLVFLSGESYELWHKSGFGLLWIVLLCYLLNFLWTPVTVLFGIGVLYFLFSNNSSSNQSESEDVTDSNRETVATVLLSKALQCFMSASPEDNTDEKEIEQGKAPKLYILVNILFQFNILQPNLYQKRNPKLQLTWMVKVVSKKPHPHQLH